MSAMNHNELLKRVEDLCRQVREGGAGAEAAQVKLICLIADSCRANYHIRILQRGILAAAGVPALSAEVFTVMYCEEGEAPLVRDVAARFGLDVGDVLHHLEAAAKGIAAAVREWEGTS